MTLRSFAVGALSCLAAACSSASTGSAPPSRTVAVGAYTVETLVDGDNFVSLVSTARSDDALSVTFERATRTARIEPKYGQSKTVGLETFPEDVDAANHRIADPLAVGFAKASAAGSAPKPKAVALPPPACANPCFDACDAQYPDAAQNAACRFGCSNGCVQR